MVRLSEDTLQEVVRRVVKALDPVGVYLFGSQARGDEEAGDVDLLVVVEQADRPMRELAREARRSLWGMAIPVDVVVCTRADLEKWSQVSGNLLHIVARQGRRVYAAEA